MAGAMAAVNGLHRLPGPVFDSLGRFMLVLVAPVVLILECDDMSRMVTKYRKIPGSRETVRSTYDAAVYTHMLQFAWYRPRDNSWHRVGQPAKTMRSLLARLKRAGGGHPGRLGIFSLYCEDGRQIHSSQAGFYDEHTGAVTVFDAYMGKIDPATAKVIAWAQTQAA